MIGINKSIVSTITGTTSLHTTLMKSLTTTLYTILITRNKGLQPEVEFSLSFDYIFPIYSIALIKQFQFINLFELSGSNRLISD